MLAATRAMVTRARCELAMVARGAPDEQLRWISASRSQPTEAATQAMAGAWMRPVVGGLGRWGIAKIPSWEGQRARWMLCLGCTS